MGFFDNSSRTVSAVLTTAGRKWLSQGQNQFKITKFAVSDEGVDYSLYNPDHPSGSNYYGEEITSMPLLEATTDESKVMRYKLVTLPKGTSKMPSITASPTSIDIGVDSRPASIIVPATTNTTAGFNNQSYGYTCILSNKKCANIEVTQVAPNQKTTTSVPTWLSDEQLKESKVVVGMEFRITALPSLGLTTAEKQGTITIIGNETGGQTEINYTVTEME